ncbi:hypothetical protein D9757_004695 [Collybiopsis confluens]|uniref:CASTOR ACT domain-containing protein n=1 Tax=Collybiopsis confluens TaxID=2823264 RepID=A0A8H5HS76_9AGAR|nr:hypothetical protein D9757_004695 [Collybiopsis confluens]
MSPPVLDARLHLTVQPGLFFVSQLQEIPVSIIDLLQSNNNRFLSLTRTSEEISIVGEWYHDIPPAFESDACWKCIKVNGPMDFALVGVVSELTAPLKKALISVFIASTWNTDYLLVKEKDLEYAVQALKDDGWTFL